MPAYTHRATGTVVGSSGSQLSPGAPAGLTNGDLMLLTVCSRAAGQTQDATLTDWTLLYSDTTECSLYIYGHIADGVNDAPQPDMSGASYSKAFIDAFYGDVETNMASILHNSTLSTSSGTNALPLPAMSTPSQDNLLVYAVGVHRNTTTTGLTISFTPEFTSTADDPATGTSRIDIAAGYWQQTTATSYDGDNWTLSGTPDSGGGTGVLLELLTGTSSGNPWNYYAQQQG